MKKWIELEFLIIEFNLIIGLRLNWPKNEMQIGDNIQVFLVNMVLKTKSWKGHKYETTRFHASLLGLG
jgi:hypothetical protein